MQQNPLQQLYDTGMYFAGVKKEFCGNVKREEFFQIPSLVTDQFGYYENEDSTWTVFVTDDERGMEITSRRCRTEEDAIVSVLDLAESNNIAHLSRVITDSLPEKKPSMTAYLKQTYGLTEPKARDITAYIYQIPDIAFEFFYYLENNSFVPDKYACCFSGYTAKRLFTEHSMTLPGAFQYMVYLNLRPEEALREL